MTLDEFKALSAYRLSEMAGVSSPDSLESPGSVLLSATRDWYVENHDEIREHGDDKLIEVSGNDTEGGVVDYRTQQAWLAFVDLAVWQYDALDQGQMGSWKWENINDAAYAALGEVVLNLARRLYEDDDTIGEEDE